MSRQFIDSRRSWRLRGHARDYQIVRNFGLAEQPGELVSANLLVAELDRWLTSLSTQRTLHELYEAVTGAPPPSTREPSRRAGEVTERVRRRLAEAFRQGELLALPVGTPRLKQWPVPTTRKGPAPLVDVPLLAQIIQALTPAKKEEQKPTAWVEFELVDSEGAALEGVTYKLTLPDGSTRQGKVDATGRVRVEGIEPGECTVTFPELDA
ncbi:MAG: carboxypeptidase-like regulatory domain-containing protein [Cystobacter sp.]